MELRIEVREEIDQSHWRHLTDWDDPVFPVEGRPFDWAPSRWHVLAYSDDDYPLAHIGFAGFDVLLAEEVVPVVGVGGVVVRPEHQGNHIPAALFGVLHDCPEALSVSDTFTLFCPRRLVTYYERHGYRRFRSDVQFWNKGSLTQAVDFSFMWYGAALAEAPLQLQGEPW